MKTLATNPLLNMKRPYQILTKAVITAFVVSAIPSFAAPLPVAEPATEFELNYVSPMTKAIQLENELDRFAKSPDEFEIPPLLVRPQSCITGSVNFNPAKCTNGWTFKPNPFVTVTLGKVQGSVAASGRYCFDGKWYANGNLEGNVKNEVFVGLKSTNWIYFFSRSFRFKYDFGLKAEANIGVNGSFNFNANSQSYENAIFNLNVKGDLLGSVATPKVTVQKYSYFGDTGKYGWKDIALNSPTNGDYVDGISFEISAYGGVTFAGGYYWEVWDNDPDSSNDSEKQRWYGTITGRAGAKLKFKNTSGQEFGIDAYWSKPIKGKGVSVDSGDQFVSVDGATDRQLDQRPR